MTFTIYLITCLVTGKVYVGQTRYTIWHRFMRHKYAARSGSKRSKLYFAIREHGEDQFIIEQITTTDSLIQANILETYYIAKFDSVNTGYNTCIDGFSHTHTEEAKQRMSLAQIGKHPTEKTRKLMSEQHKGEKNVMYGKNHTQEVKDRISAKMKGKPGFWKGKHLPQEVRDKVSASRKGLTTGEKNPAAKLTLTQVEEIRDLFKSSKLTRQQIADQFGVSLSAIKRIKAGTHWK